LAAVNPILVPEPEVSEDEELDPPDESP
jgi:hypothetical protein